VRRKHPAAPVVVAHGYGLVRVGAACGQRVDSDLEALEETIAVLSDAAVMQALAQAEAELARGEGEGEESLAAAMRER